MTTLTLSPPRTAETTGPTRTGSGPRSARTTARLTPEQVQELARELDAIRADVMNDLGDVDARYIHRVLATQRWLEGGSRVVLLFSGNWIAWTLGTAGLTVAKILENMEIGHNILHGQWDWMRDPKIHSTTWEWDAVSPASGWKHSHNELHHAYTNVVGKDNDLGYGMMRVNEAQPWSPKLLGQPLYNLINALIFEYGIASYDLQLFDQLKGEGRPREEFNRDAKQVLIKIAKQVGKDYIAYPLLSGRNAPTTLLANLVANTLRNLWTHSVIICGHFPDGVEVFEKESIEGETKGDWYLRQMLGSANISGSTLMHIMTGNLSHQIEHHLFPDMPSRRYAEVRPKVKALFDKYGLAYVEGPLPKQVGSAWRKVFRLSLPNPEPGRSRLSIVAESIGQAVRPSRRPRGQLAIA